MCLAKVYNEEGAEPLLDSVTSVSVDNDRLIFTTLFGENKFLQAPSSVSILVMPKYILLKISGVKILSV